MAVLKAKKRNAMPDGEFADPVRRRFPVQDAKHVRAALSRLAGEVNAGRMSRATASKIHGRIAAAGKKHGVDVKLDLAPTSVHSPGALKPIKKGVTLRGTLGPGGSIHVRHHLDDGSEECSVLLGSTPLRYGDEVDPIAAGITLKGPSEYSTGERVKLVWVQIAQAGSWKGHAQGPFALTAQTFAEIKNNFDKRGIPVMFDLNHVSESDPTEGTLPMVERTKAWGWTHKLDHRGDGLWGLTEWLEETRDGIKAGKFGYLSPAIRLRSKDQVTGADAGARLTSVAVTNNPFLSHMPGLIAASDAVTHSHSHEFMPAIRACLRCDDMATPQECSDKLDKLRAYHELGDGKAVQGVDVPAMMGDMRSRMNLPLTHSDDQLFEAVQSMIDSAIAEHEEKFRAQDHELDDDDSGGDSGEGDGDEGTEMSMATAEEKLAEANVKARELEIQLTAANAKITGLEAQVVLLTTNVAAGEDAIKKLADIQVEQNDREVSEAISVYATTKGLKEELRPHLLSFISKDPVGFRAMYPRIGGRDAILMANLTGGRRGERGDTVHTNGGSELSEAEKAKLPRITLGMEPADAVDEVIRCNATMTRDEARVEAQKLLMAARRAMNGRH